MCTNVLFYDKVVKNNQNLQVLFPFFVLLHLCVNIAPQTLYLRLSLSPRLSYIQKLDGNCEKFEDKHDSEDSDTIIVNALFKFPVFFLKF